MLRTTDEIIDALGGTNVVAGLTQRKAQQVSYWRASGKFPASTFLVMTNELGRRGLNAPASIWGMTEPEHSTATTERMPS